MREIKFRAWDKWNEVMFYSSESGDGKSDYAFYFLSDGKLHARHSINKTDEDDEWHSSEDFPGEIMQSSGLLDRHGVEIYEGDIVEYSSENYEVMFGEHEVPGDYNDFDAYGFYLSKIKIPSFMHERPLLGFTAGECIIIGNRFQHPELLNAK